MMHQISYLNNCSMKQQTMENQKDKKIKKYSKSTDSSYCVKQRNVDSVAIINAVDKSIYNYHFDLKYRLNIRGVQLFQNHMILGGQVWHQATKETNSNFRKIRIKDQYVWKITMKDVNSSMNYEKIVLSEMSLDLWSQALCSTLADTSLERYPHYLVIQRIINHLLNTNFEDNLGICIEVLNRVLLFHPPSRHLMRCYYRRIIDETYVVLCEKGTEEQNLFWCLIDSLQNLTSIEFQDAKDDHDDGWNVSKTKNIDEETNELTEWLNNNSNETPLSMFQKRVNTRNNSFYENLKPLQKKDRCVMCLNFVVDIIESDYLSWFSAHSEHDKHLLRQDDKPILAQLLWSDTIQMGILNQNVRRLISVRHALKDSNMERSSILPIDRLICIASELTRISDMTKNSIYPFFKTNSFDFAREYAVSLLEKMKSDSKKLINLVEIKPSWLRLLICCNLLENLTGNVCYPELFTVTEILVYIQRIYSQNVNKERSADRTSHKKLNEKLIKKLKGLRSVNARSKSGDGDTHLHIACRSNKIEEVQALLSFSELDINVSNSVGWTPLHEACHMGHTDCVEELLKFSPKLGLQRPVDIRIKGDQGFTPLLCAIAANHVNVCRVLLEHAGDHTLSQGSVLLDDVTDDNKTAQELSMSDEMRQLIRYYKENDIQTVHSVKLMFFEKVKTKTVVSLCTQMTQAYLATHRTWDVYHEVKKKENKVMNTKQASNDNIKTTIKYQYTRYHRDFKTYLPKLRKVVHHLVKLRILRDELQPLMCAICLNKCNYK